MPARLSKRWQIEQTIFSTILHWNSLIRLLSSISTHLIWCNIYVNTCIEISSTQISHDGTLMKKEYLSICKKCITLIYVPKSLKYSKFCIWSFKFFIILKICLKNRQTLNIYFKDRTSICLKLLNLFAKVQIHCRQKVDIIEKKSHAKVQEQFVHLSNKNMKFRCQAKAEKVK